MNQHLTAMITGGSHGIGRGIAFVLARRGYDIAITYNSRKDDALQVQKEIQSLGRRCFVYHGAFTDEAAPEAVAEQAISDLGRLDLMVCNAGLTRHYSILNITNEQITDLFNLNYRAYLLCAKVAARHMVREGIKGSIIFITSSRGSRAYPEDMLYGGFKAGVERACESIALDLAPYGIRANCVAPGWTVTSTVDELPDYADNAPFVPLGRAGLPVEMGEAVAYLASPAAAYITGITLRLDGGLILSGFPESLRDSAQWLNPQWTEKQRALLDETEDNEHE